MDHTEEDWKRMAAQLRCPSGEHARETAEYLNEGNSHMNHKAIDILHWKKDDRVLEIGPGNGAFVSYMLKKAKGITYTGIDLSPEMVEAAKTVNHDSVSDGIARFYEGTSDELPFPDNYFDKILTANTVYFWANPVKHLREICRVLKPGGEFCLAWRSKNFMQHMPFTAWGFTMYNPDELKPLVESTELKILREYGEEEESIPFSGALIKKDMQLIVASKA